MIGKDKKIDNEIIKYRRIFAVLVFLIFSVTLASYILTILINPLLPTHEPPRLEMSGTECFNITLGWIKIHDPDDLLRFHNVDLYIIDGDNVIFKSSFFDLLDRTGDAYYVDIDGDFRFSRFDYLSIGGDFKRPGLNLRGIYTPFNSEAFNYVLG